MHRNVMEKLFAIKYTDAPPEIEKALDGSQAAYDFLPPPEKLVRKVDVFMKKIIFSGDAPAPIGPYSQAILANGVLYCSGQLAADRLDGDVTEQTAAVCENITAVLAAAGMELQNVVKTTCFLADMADFARFNGIYEKYFAHKPARSCVAVKELPRGALVEIEVVALADA